MRPTARIPSVAVLVLSCLAFALSLIVVTAPAASALSTVTVRVVIERVDEQGCTDNLSGSDFYGQIDIEGQAFDFGRIDGEDTITPNWTAEKVLDANVLSSATVVIRVADYDNFLNFGDDVCDISRNDGTDLDLEIPFFPCSVTGDATGSCATSIDTGGSGGGQGDADLRFRVEVDLPASTPGLTVRCTHAPLWPQPGDNVTITVESFDGTVQVGDTQADTSSGAAPPLVNHTKLADHVEIWATGPVPTSTSPTRPPPASWSTTSPPVTSSTAAGCRTTATPSSPAGGGPVWVHPRKVMRCR